MPGARHHPQLRAAVGLGHQSGIDLRNHIVVAPVQEKEGAWRQPLGSLGCLDQSQLLSPSRQVFGKSLGFDCPYLVGVSQETLVIADPIVKVSWRTHHCRASNVVVIGDRLQANAATGTKAAHPDPGGLGLFSERCYASSDVVHPPAKAEVPSGGTATTKTDGQGHPSQLVGDSIGQLGEVSADVFSPHRP